MAHIWLNSQNCQTSAYACKVAFQIFVKILCHENVRY